ncbi:MAG TPA: D-glycerate dehydrogenase [Thermodesulfobacteriota bacterium]|nr:D-glycerate dehydrogenase [Thermodesulfobacteriota bacterium]
MKKVFITASLPGRAIELLKRDFHIEVFPEERSPTRDEILEGARDAHALITMVVDRVDRSLIDSCPDLRVISNCGVGTENIDIPYATQKGICVTNTPDVLTETTADLVWALILSVSRRVVEGDSYVREGKFIGWRPTLLLGQNVHGKTLGIYGMGRIGTAVCRRAKGFNMRVIYNNRSRNEEGERETGAEYVDFSTLLRESDFVVITSPLNESSQGRFGLEEFRKMKRGSIIVNVGRGPIVKEKELVIALKEGLIWGAGLDVYEREPVVEEELLKLNNVILLPHLGSASQETRERMAEMAAEGVIMVLKNRVPRNLVNPEVLSKD